MADFVLQDFTQRIKDTLLDNFPEMKGEYLSSWGVMQTREQKHPKSPRTVKEIALGRNLITIISDNMSVFDIGNEEAERNYPYYHILEDSPVIHKRNKGTEQSRGSQATIKNLSDRDYAIVNFSGKTFTREYAKNVRGARKSVIDRSQRIVDGKKINETSRTYVNIHYHYIERILDATLPFIAQEFGLRQIRTIDSGLADDYIMSNYNIQDENMGYDTISELVENMFNM